MTTNATENPMTTETSQQPTTGRYYLTHRGKIFCHEWEGHHFHYLAETQPEAEQLAAWLEHNHQTPTLGVAFLEDRTLLDLKSCSILQLAEWADGDPIWHLISDHAAMQSPREAPRLSNTEISLLARAMRVADIVDERVPDLNNTIDSNGIADLFREPIALDTMLEYHGDLLGPDLGAAVVDSLSFTPIYDDGRIQLRTTHTAFGDMITCDDFLGMCTVITARLYFHKWFTGSPPSGPTDFITIMRLLGSVAQLVLSLDRELDAISNTIDLGFEHGESALIGRRGYADFCGVLSDNERAELLAFIRDISSYLQSVTPALCLAD
jgi:hypothetical protein